MSRKNRGGAATKLPSQVQKISDNAEALAKETGIKPGEKPASAASDKLKVVADPGAPKPKGDQGDYKTRYINYKKATDITISELRTTLASVQSTLATVQEQNRQILANANNGGQPAAVVDTTIKSPSITREDPAYKLYLEKLPTSIKDEYTEDYLFDQFVIQTSVNGYADSKSEDLSALETKVDGVVDFQERTRAQLYEEAMDEAFPNDEWITLATGDAWSLFCDQRVSAVDQRTYGQIVKEGSDTQTAETVIWVLNEFKKHQKSELEESDTTVVVDPLLSHVVPEGGASGGGDLISQINAQAETFTETQVNQFFIDVATTKKYSAEEAAAIEQNILAAQTAGKIIPG